MYERPSDKYPKNWNRLRFWVFKRDKFKCQRCGRKTSHPECHHIKPIGLGGSHHPTNLVTLCRRCHQFIYRSYYK